jgi:hypothetical protein
VRDVRAGGLHEGVHEEAVVLGEEGGEVVHLAQHNHPAVLQKGGGGYGNGGEVVREGGFEGMTIAVAV